MLLSKVIYSTMIQYIFLSVYMVSAGIKPHNLSVASAILPAEPHRAIGLVLKHCRLRALQTAAVVNVALV